MGSYDEDTAFLGQKGPFFALLFFLLNAIYISTGLHGLYIVFVGASPSHHCRVPEGNLSEEWMRAVIPEEMVNGKLQASQCWRYSLETVGNLSAHGVSPQDLNLTDINLERCVDGWRYSTDTFSSTIVSEWDLVCDSKWRVPFATSTLYMGYLLGSLVSGQLSDRFGRKKVLFTSLAAEALLMFAQSFSHSWLLFCLLYFFVGTFQISLYLTAFVLGSEVLSKSLRVLFTTLGAFLHYCIGYMVLPWIAFAVRDWRILLRVLSGVTVVYVPLWWLIPESPRWLLSQGRVLESEAIVREAAKKNKVPAPEVIFSQVKEAGSQCHQYSVLDVLRTSEIRKTTFMCLLLWMAINIGYFGLSLNTANLSGDPFLNCFLSAVTEVPAYIVSTFLLKSCPRRPVLSAFLIIGGGFLLLLQMIPDIRAHNTHTTQHSRPVLSAFLIIGGGFLLLLQMIPDSKSSQHTHNTTQHTQHSRPVLSAFLIIGGGFLLLLQMIPDRGGFLLLLQMIPDSKSSQHTHTHTHTTQHNTTQHNTTQHNTTQHNTADPCSQLSSL
ncbi:unnamed protein product [Leuciscus chuanchicus]